MSPCCKVLLIIYLVGLKHTVHAQLQTDLLQKKRHTSRRLKSGRYSTADRPQSYRQYHIHQLSPPYASPLKCTNLQRDFVTFIPAPLAGNVNAVYPDVFLSPAGRWYHDGQFNKEANSATTLAKGYEGNTTTQTIAYIESMLPPPKHSVHFTAFCRVDDISQLIAVGSLAADEAERAGTASVSSGASSSSGTRVKHRDQVLGRPPGRLVYFRSLKGQTPPVSPANAINSEVARKFLTDSGLAVHVHKNGNNNSHANGIGDGASDGDTARYGYPLGGGLFLKDDSGAAGSSGSRDRGGSGTSLERVLLSLMASSSSSSNSGSSGSSSGRGEWQLQSGYPPSGLGYGTDFGWKRSDSSASSSASYSGQSSFSPLSPPPSSSSIYLLLSNLTRTMLYPTTEAYIIEVGNGLVGPSGLVWDRNGYAYPLGAKWYTQKGFRSKTRIVQSHVEGRVTHFSGRVLSLRDDFTVFSHLVFQVLPKLGFVCDWLVRKENMDVRVFLMSSLHADFTKTLCPEVDESRFLFLANDRYGVWSSDAVLFPSFRRWSDMQGDPRPLVPHQLLRPLTERAIPHQRSKLLLMIGRDMGRVRGVDNEVELNRAILRTLPSGWTYLVMKEPKDWRKDMEIVRRASIIIGPHGGQFGNLLFAPPQSLFIELIHYEKKSVSIRPCYLGLAHALNLRYIHARPTDFVFQKYAMTAPTADIIAALVTEYARCAIADQHIVHQHQHQYQYIGGSAGGSAGGSPSGGPSGGWCGPIYGGPRPRRMAPLVELPQEYATIKPKNSPKGTRGRLGTAPVPHEVRTEATGVTVH